MRWNLQHAAIEREAGIASRPVLVDSKNRRHETTKKDQRHSKDDNDREGRATCMQKKATTRKLGHSLIATKNSTSCQCSDALSSHRILGWERYGTRRSIRQRCSLKL